MKGYRFNPCRKLPPAAFWLLAGFTYQVLADGLPAETDDFPSHWEAASDAELAQLRGGFTLPNGVTFDFSMEKIIYLNDTETFTATFKLPNNATFFQNGLQNTASEWAGSGLGSVIQNNLDNQAIKSLTTINIDLGNLRNLSQAIAADTFRNLTQPAFQ
jgi:hypothetical protein